MTTRTVTLGGNSQGPDIESDDEIEVVDVRRRAAEQHVFVTSDDSSFSDENERARRRAAAKAYADAMKARPAVADDE